MSQKKKYGIEPCSCGHPTCKKYWLTGIGEFVQSFGFTKEEAERIADLLNQDAASKCIRPEGCVCGGDLPSIRQGCGYWRKS